MFKIQESAAIMHFTLLFHYCALAKCLLFTMQRNVTWLHYFLSACIYVNCHCCALTLR